MATNLQLHPKTINNKMVTYQGLQDFNNILIHEIPRMGSDNDFSASTLNLAWGIGNKDLKEGKFNLLFGEGNQTSTSAEAESSNHNILFGTNNFVQAGDYNVILGNECKIYKTPRRIFMFGEGLECPESNVTDEDSNITMIFGKYNRLPETASNSALIIGNGSEDIFRSNLLSLFYDGSLQVNASEDFKGITYGYECDNVSTSALVYGIAIKNGGETTINYSGEGSIICGSNIDNRGHTSIVCGFNSNFLTLNGKSTHNEGSMSIVCGPNLQNYGNSSIVCGHSSQNHSNMSILLGTDNISERTVGSVALLGHHLQVTKDFPSLNRNGYTTVLGAYNDLDGMNDTTAFVIGAGTADNQRHNLLQLDYNGDFYIKGKDTESCTWQTPVNFKQEVNISIGENAVSSFSNKNTSFTNNEVAITATNKISLSGLVEVNGSALLSNTLTVSEDTMLDKALTVKGQTILDKALTVNGATTLTKELYTEHEVPIIGEKANAAVGYWTYYTLKCDGLSDGIYKFKIIITHTNEKTGKVSGILLKLGNAITCFSIHTDNAHSSLSSSNVWESDGLCENNSNDPIILQNPYRRTEVFCGSEWCGFKAGVMYVDGGAFDEELPDEIKEWAPTKVEATFTPITLEKK